MAVKLSNAGGTDLTDSETGEAQDWIDTFEAVMAYLKLYTDATEHSTSNTNWTTASSFTLSANGKTLMSQYISCQLKGDGTHSGSVRLKISGTNLGDIYIGRTLLTGTSAEGIGIHATNSLFSQGTATYYTYSTGFCVPITLVDDTTTFTVQFRCSNVAGTAYVDEIDWRVMYAHAISV